MRKLATGMMLGLFLAGPLHARYYFHKANETRESYQAARSECLRLMGGAKAPNMPYLVPHNSALTAGQNLAVVGITSFFSGMMEGAAKRKTVNAVERICMADKGYARFEVPDKLGDEIESIADPEARLERYFLMATAAEPVGERMVE